MTTIGVAIAIPEPYGSELQGARARFGDPLASAIPTHVTLLPPTEVDPAELPKIDQHLDEVTSWSASFGIRLRGTGTFRPVSPVVFVALTEGRTECGQLANAVRSGPLAGELDFPYHPHVTVAHHLPEPRLDEAFDELAAYDASFDVDSLGLYRHDADGVWRMVGAHALRAARVAATDSGTAPHER